MRDGEWSSIDASLVVQGDIVEIKGGDRIPADVRVIESKSFKVRSEKFYYYYQWLVEETTINSSTFKR